MGNWYDEGEGSESLKRKIAQDALKDEPLISKYLKLKDKPILTDDLKKQIDETIEFYHDYINRPIPHNLERFKISMEKMIELYVEI